MSNIWLTSDLHFNHSNVCKFTNRVEYTTTEEVIEKQNKRFQIKL